MNFAELNNFWAVRSHIPFYISGEQWEGSCSGLKQFWEAIDLRCPICLFCWTVRETKGVSTKLLINGPFGSKVQGNHTLTRETNFNSRIYIQKLGKLELQNKSNSEFKFFVNFSYIAVIFPHTLWNRMKWHLLEKS